MKNWLTTVIGFAVAGGAWLAHSSTGVLQSIGVVISIVGPAILGSAAADSSSTK